MTSASTSNGNFIAEVVYIDYHGVLGFYGQVVQTFHPRSWVVGQIVKDPEEFLYDWEYLKGQDAEKSRENIHAVLS